MGLEEIKIELVDKNTKNLSEVLPHNANDSGSNMDSYNDDDEVEDENRNPVTI